MQNANLSITKVIAVAVLATLALYLLARAGISDYHARASERQAVAEEARRLKSHPLVVNGCETDAECERLDAMLATIHASYE